MNNIIVLLLCFILISGCSFILPQVEVDALMKKMMLPEMVFVPGAIFSFRAEYGR